MTYRTVFQNLPSPGLHLIMFLTASVDFDCLVDTKAVKTRAGMISQLND